MTWQLKVAAYLISLVILAAIGYSIYHYGTYIKGLEEDNKRKDAVIAQDEEDKKFLFDLSEKRRIADEKRANEGRKLDIDYSDLRGVSISLPNTCETPSSTPSDDSDGTGGMASSPAHEDMDRLGHSLEAQRAFDQAKLEIDKIAKRCADINLDAIKANESR